MSEAVHTRVHGLQALLKVEVARPTIDSYHVRFALARRPRISWQHLGNMLRVNALDLQRACDHPDLVQPAFAVPAAKAPAPGAAAARRPRQLVPTVGGGSLEHQALIAVGNGHGLSLTLAAAVGRDRQHGNALIQALRTKGLVRRAARFEAATLTEAGHAELHRLEALSETGEADW